MEKFVIQGGVPLSGEIVAAGNKNAALPLLAACLLTEEEVTLRNIPRIRDVETQVGLLETMGVETMGGERIGGLYVNPHPRWIRCEEGDFHKTDAG